MTSADILPPILLGLATLGSGTLVFLFPKCDSHHFSYILTFAGSYLFSLTLTHLLPEVYEEGQEQNICVANYILLGFFIQFVLDLVGGSIAHGHIVHPVAQTQSNSSISLVAALCCHAFIEGLILPSVQTGVWCAILLHKLPAAFTLTSWCYHRQKKIQPTLLALFLFAISSPLGYFFYACYPSDPHTFLIINAIATGTLFHIATVMLFEANPHHQLNIKKFSFITLGAACTILSNSFTP